MGCVPGALEDHDLEASVHAVAEVASGWCEAESKGYVEFILEDMVFDKCGGAVTASSPISVAALLVALLQHCVWCGLTRLGRPS